MTGSTAGASAPPSPCRRSPSRRSPPPRATPASPPTPRASPRSPRPRASPFPRDHGPHPDFRIEWWYVTADLAGPDGTPYGIQWTLFRQAMAPGDRPGWESPQVWMAHAAVTSATDHRFAETFARGGVGQAGVALSPFRAFIDDWSMTGADDSLAALTLRAEGKGFAYDLHLATDRPPVPQGDNGYSVKSGAGPGVLLLQPALLRGHRHPDPRRTGRPRNRPGLARPRVVVAAPDRRPGRLGLVRAPPRHRREAHGLPPPQQRRLRLARRHLDRPGRDAGPAPPGRDHGRRRPPGPRSPAAASRPAGTSRSPRPASRWTSRRSTRKAGWAPPTPTGRDRSPSPAPIRAAATSR